MKRSMQISDLRQKGAPCEFGEKEPAACLFRSVASWAFICLFFTVSVVAQNIKNPVLPGVADAGVIKFNGKYYVGGVFTNGDFYVSKDLVRWEGPVHVFSMDNEWTKDSGAGDNQIHANDMVYINGIFHLYWSVNYWGQDKHIVHIGHAVSDEVLGPYREPLKETWIDNRIDPKIFQDDDGKLYLYMVKFTDGNTIWVRPVKDDGVTFDGPPVYQFASLPGTWETMDNRVAEGPWVIKYRNRYYMMYNANHTGTAWGNYQLGVAEAGSPLMFNNGNKYPYPLLLSNQTYLEDYHTDLLLFDGDRYAPYFSYTTEEPGADWLTVSYSDLWKKGRPGFASGKTNGSTVRKYGTEWRSDKLFLQKVFSCASHPGNLALRINHDGDTRVYLNGKKIYDRQGADYRIINLSNDTGGYLSDDKNILAIETARGRRSNYINVSLFDLKNDKADDILFSPGQPNILRGPNGFEWWLIYMANKNNERRGQYINRVYFFDKTMYCDGVTAESTEGYFPAPTKPTRSEMSYPNGAGEYTLVDTEYAGLSYLFEVGIDKSEDAGVIAWRKDSDNRIKVGLDKKRSCWYLESCFDGITEREDYPLPDGFNFDVFHSIRVERNINRFHISIDNLRASSFLFPEAEGHAIPGLFIEKGSSSFDGITYTLGWDEFDENITGWNHYEVSAKGIFPLSEGKEETFKGDFLSQYEYALQVTNTGDIGVAGVYPLYIDESNYVKAGFNYDTNRFCVTAVKRGKTVYNESFSLEDLNTHYADMKYTDSFEKACYFRTPTILNEIQLNKIPVDNDTLFIDNMFEHLRMEYLDNGKWMHLSGGSVDNAPNLLYTSMKFNPVKTEAIRFINKKARDENRYIYKIKVNEIFKDSYQLRTVKLKDKLLLFVDGKRLCVINHAYPAAQVGLYSEGCIPSYNGILRYHIPE